MVRPVPHGRSDPRRDREGRETQRLVGYMPKEKLLSMLNPHLGDSKTSAA